MSDANGPLSLWALPSLRDLADEDLAGAVGGRRLASFMGFVRDDLPALSVPERAEHLADCRAFIEDGDELLRQVSSEAWPALLKALTVTSWECEVLEDPGLAWRCRQAGPGGSDASSPEEPRDVASITVIRSARRKARPQ